MNALLDGARRVANRATGRFRRRLRRDDGGFVLLESIIAISLISVIMAAIGVEYVAGIASVARQRATQSASQVADSTLEQIRALKPSDLVTGRGVTTVQTQFAKGNAISTVSPWLQQMDQTSDANAAATDGANATIPTCDPTPQGAAGPAVCTQKPGTVAFTVAQFLGTCWLVTSGTTSNCVPAAQKTSGSVQYLRAVVSVGWTSGSCTAGCYYVTSTLINAAADPTFKANQPPPASPAISAPGNQNDDIGDSVALQLSLQTGTGIPGFTWDITSGALPAGLSLSTSGLISGTVRGPTSSAPLTVRVTDGFGRQDTSTFTWTISNLPQITALSNQVTAINVPVSLQVATTCTGPSCVYTLNNPPTGLSINNTGLITGTPRTAGTNTMSVTVTDAANNAVTSNTFTWTVLAAAATCPTAVTLPNGSFETPGVGAGAGSNVGNGTSGMAWRTNDANNQIEYWANGGNSTSQNGNTAISAKDGSQWVEVNGAGMDTLYQDLPTTPGQVLQWSLWHRARNATNNVNAQDSIQVQMGSTSQQAAQVPSGATSPTISDGAAAWVQYTGVYTVPAGQTTTRFQVAATAVSSVYSGVGNFLDAVTVTGVPCLPTAVQPRTSTVNAATSFQLPASQGSGSYTWSGGNTLPAGLSLSPSGLITGAATSAGSSPVRLIVTDQLSGFQQLVTFTWTVVAAPTITTPANQTTTVGAAVNLTPASTCSNPTCTYTVSSLPAGLTLNSGTGAITGNPTTTGTSTSTVTITDAAGVSATSGSFIWTIKAAPTVTAPANQTTTVGSTVSITVGSTCPNTPCSYVLNNPPGGLSMTGATITGNPTTIGTVTSTVTITDAAGISATSGSFTWTIKTAPTVTAPANQTTTVGSAVSITVGSTCPNTPCTYVLNNPPGGLSMTGATITGSPTTAATVISTITITDAAGVSATSGSFTWTVKAAPTVTAPANQTTSIGSTVSITVGSTCPNTPCTYTLNNPPAGLSMTGATITGSPTTAGTVTSTITITDAAGVSATSGSFTWTVYAGPTITSPGNQTGTVGVAVSVAVTSTCAYQPCTYSLNGQPAGLTISSSGVITGTPTTAGTSSTVTATVTDAGGATRTTSSFSWLIYARPTIVTPANQTSTVNTALILPISSTCAHPSCSFALTGGPAGLSINASTGRITGTPTATGTSSSVKVTVTDAGGVAVSTATFTWTITAGPSVTSPANQSTVNNAAVNLALTTSCPNPSCAYRLNNGPAGLTISSAGVVSGKVTSAPQTFSGVTITVTDNSGATATSAAFTWTVTAPLAGRWTFDEASGTTAADSAGSHPATLSGGYGKTGTAAQGANALTLNGTSGTAATSGAVLNTSSSFTVSAWVKLNTLSGYQTFVSQDGTNVGGFFLQYNPDTNRLRFYKLASDSTGSSGASQSSLANPVVGQWYQMTGVYDSSAQTISLFINGVRQGAPVSAPNGFNATGSFVMGRANFGGATNFVNGAIDDVRAYGSALSDDAVTQLAQAGYWRFDEGSGTTAQDSSLNNISGTLSGGTSWTTGIVGPSALQFNGSSGFVTATPDPIDTSQSFSVSAWARVNSTSSTGAVISADGANISSFVLRQDNNRWAMVSVSNDSGSPSAVTNVYSSSGLSVGQWYHLVGVYDSAANTLALYVNGVLQGTPVSAPASFKATGSLLIGRSRFGAGTGGQTNFYNGAIDDVRAYQFAADQSVVNTLATLTPPAPAAPTAVAGTTSATVSWTAPVNVGGSPVTGYVVTPYLDGVAQTSVSYNSTATSQTVTGLSTGQSYTFSVAATDANGTSPPSSVSAAVLVS